MKNQLSDLEKAFTYFLPSLVIFLIFMIIAVVVEQIAGGIGIAVLLFISIIIGIGVYFFVKLSSREQKYHMYKNLSYNDSKTTDAVMKRIYEVYNIKEEPEEEADDDYDDANEALNEVNDYFYPATDNYQDETFTRQIADKLNSEMLWLFGFAWIFGAQFLKELNIDFILKSAESDLQAIIVLFPVSFLWVLSGIVILIKGKYTKNGSVKIGWNAYFVGIGRVAIGAIIGAFLLFGKL